MLRSNRVTNLVSSSRVEILEFFDCGVGGGLCGEVTAGSWVREGCGEGTSGNQNGDLEGLKRTRCLRVMPQEASHYHLCVGE